MSTINRPLKLAAVALGLFAVAGCAEDNEKNFAPIPGSAPPGAPVDGERVKVKKTKSGKEVVTE
jgi:hypothetical protein